MARDNEESVLLQEESRLAKMIEERATDLQTLRHTLLQLKKEKQKWIPEKLGRD